MCLTVGTTQMPFCASNAWIGSVRTFLEHTFHVALHSMIAYCPNFTRLCSYRHRLTLKLHIQVWIHRLGPVEHYRRRRRRVCVPCDQLVGRRRVARSSVGRSASGHRANHAKFQQRPTDSAVGGLFEVSAHGERRRVEQSEAVLYSPAEELGPAGGGQKCPLRGPDYAVVGPNTTRY